MTLHPFHPPGRGRKYTPLRGVSEVVLQALYRGDWPARAWDRMPDHRNALGYVRASVKEGALQ